jgi:hypothetical protein
MTKLFNYYFFLFMCVSNKCYLVLCLSKNFPADNITITLKCVLLLPKRIHNFIVAQVHFPQGTQINILFEVALIGNMLRRNLKKS